MAADMERNQEENAARVLVTEQAWRRSHREELQCIEEELPACTTSCPFQIDIRDILGKLQKGQFDAAFRRYSNSVGFPFLVSRYCGARCRSSCIMERHGGALDMPGLERAVLQYARNTKPNRYNMPPKKERIAVVGAGVSGLGCALRLLNRKYPVSVFEASERAGGSFLKTADPAFLQEEIDRQFQFEKCDWHFNTEISDPKALLEQGYAAVYVATGKTGDRFEFPKEDGIFYGGEMTGADPMQALAQGLKAPALIEGFLKTGVMRDSEPEKETRIQLAERFIREKPLVVPEDGERFTREEAMEEASRCFQCQCDACMHGCHHGVREEDREGHGPGGLCDCPPRHARRKRHRLHPFYRKLQPLRLLHGRMPDRH